MKTFCKHCDIICDYQTEDDFCSKSKDYKNVSEDTFVFIPEDCDHYGTIFLKLEEVKQKVRKYKEEIIHYEAIIASGSKEEKVYKKIIDSLNKFIDKYKTFGADNW